MHSEATNVVQDIMKIMLALGCVLALALLAGQGHGRSLQQSVKGLSWKVPSTGGFDPVYIPVGGALDFIWQGSHSVYEVPSYACPSNFTTGATEIAGIANGGMVSVSFPQRGVRYFACSVPTHCERGQLVAVSSGVSPAPAPAYGPSIIKVPTAGPSQG